VAPHQRGQLGHPDGDSRILTRVYGSSTGHGGRPPDSFAQRRSKASGVVIGGAGFVRQERGLSNQRTQPSTGFRGHIFPRTQEVRSMAANNQLEATQRVHQTKTLPYGTYHSGSQCSQQQHMGYLNRPTRRISAYTNTSVAPKVAAFQDWQPSIRLPLPAIWPVHGTTGVHTCGQVGGSVSSSSGYNDLRISRRLVDNSAYIFTGGDAYAQSDSNCGVSGVPDQQGQVASHAYSASNIFGNSLGLGSWSCDANSGEGGSTADVGTVTYPPSSRVGVRVAAGPRSYGESSRHSTMVQASDATTPDTPHSLLSSADSSAVANGPDDRHCSAGTGMVVRPSQYFEGSSISGIVASADVSHRRFLNRVGGPHRFASDQRSLERGGIAGSHKHTGASSGSQVTGTFSRLGSSQENPHQVGQRNGGLLHQQTGGDEVSVPVSLHAESLPMVHRQRCSATLDSHSGGRQLVSRQFIARYITPSNRMGTISSRGVSSVQRHVDANDRSLCIAPQSPAPSLLFQGSRRARIRSRRSIHRLVGDGGIRVSPPILNSEGSQQDIGRYVHGVTHSSVLATPVVVSTAAQSSGGSTTIASDNTRSTSNASNIGEIPRRKVAQFDCLDAIQRKFEKAGLSSESAKLVARGRRHSTLKVYSPRVKLFIKWCRARQIRPDRASVAQVADFLREVFEKGLQASTVRGYLSAIMIIHVSTPSGSSLKNSETLRLLIEGMHNVAPPTRKIWPSWDLNIVLDALNQRPYEPILSASLRDATTKAAFLIAVASARRCSELHALAIGSHIVFSRRGATLYFRSKFLAKNERSNFRSAPISLPKLDKLSGNRRLSCPVRALKWYISKTQLVRGDIEQLFITTTKPYRPAARATIARWLVEAIVNNNALQSDGRPNAHSTRAVSTSTAFHRGVSIQDIVNTVSWKTDHVFITTYLKDQPPESASTVFAEAVLGSSSSL